MKKASCKTCKYFKQTKIIKDSEEKIINYQGDCMRFPPSLEHSLNFNYLYPKVDMFCWCGEYKPKKSSK